LQRSKEIDAKTEWVDIAAPIPIYHVSSNSSDRVQVAHQKNPRKPPKHIEITGETKSRICMVGTAAYATDAKLEWGSADCEAKITRLRPLILARYSASSATLEIVFTKRNSRGEYELNEVSKPRRIRNFSVSSNRCYCVGASRTVSRQNTTTSRLQAIKKQSS
jgi:hypothetical protein